MITNLKKYPKVKICGYSHGFYDKKIIDEVVDLKPDFLFLALPSPKLFGYKIENVISNMSALGEHMI